MTNHDGSDLGDERRRRATLRLRLRDADGNPVRARAVALLLEHVPVGAEQSRLETEEGDVLEGKLAAGEYTLQLFAKGFDIVNGLVEVGRDDATEIDLQLTPREDDFRKPTLKERLARYDLSPDDIDAQPLVLRRGANLTLDRRFPDDRARRALPVRNMDDLRRWLGSPDDVFTHERPKFGDLPDPEILKDVSPERTPSSELSAPQRSALAAIAREYIHGNVAAVSGYQAVLDGYVTANLKEVGIYAFLFSDVVIGPGATLEIGGSSSVFFATRLRIHTTGTLSVVGSVKADIGAYEEFS